MKPEQKSNIYDRLLDIKMSIEIQTVPNPRYINEKIGECRRYIEEVEKFMFQVSREFSVIQQALNNSTAEYETKKETLLTKDEAIKGLPSIKDREAKANSLLKEETNRIRGYQNESNDLNNLLRAINLKMKNLNGANADIKMQLRIMESQIKLNSGPGTDVAMKSLMEEMSKSRINKDMFEGIQTSAEETKIEDPTRPLDIQSMLKNETMSESEDDMEEETEELSETEEPSWSSFNGPQWNSADIKEESQEESHSIDLDKVIDIKPIENKGGTEPQKEVIEQTILESKESKVISPPTIQSVVTGVKTQKSGENQIDVDWLLNNFNTK
jgi:hypothetical protein